MYVNHYANKIYSLFFSNDHILLETLIGTSAEALSKKIIELDLTTNLPHISYVSRELKKAEICLAYGKPYIQDETSWKNFKDNDFLRLYGLFMS